MRKQSFSLAFGALITALSLIVLSLSTVLPDGLLVFQAIAGLLIGMVVASCGLKTGFVAYGAVGILSLILLPDGLLVFQAIAGLLIGMVVASCGLKTGFVAYGAVGILSLILLPDKGEGVLFLIMFGLYPMVKAAAEKRAVRWQRVLLKGGFGALSIGAALWFLGWLLAPEAESKPLLLAAGLPLGLAVLVLYDVAFTRVMNLYYVRLEPLLKRGRRHGGWS